MQVNASKWVRQSSRVSDAFCRGMGPATARRLPALSHQVMAGARKARSRREGACFTALLGVVLTASFTLGCRSEKEREVSRELARMTHLINQLRDAPHNAKEAPLLAASAEPCKAAPACELQQVCVQAYRLHADAVQMGVVASRAGSKPELVRDVLERAERDLALAKEGMERCVALQGELTREYKL